jgi:hypothetical protein
LGVVSFQVYCPVTPTGLLFLGGVNRATARTMTNEDIRDLLSLMPRAVDYCGSSAPGRFSATKPGKLFPRAFLRDHGKDVACYRLDPREEGKLMVGIMFNDGEAKIIARKS